MMKRLIKQKGNVDLTDGKTARRQDGAFTISHIAIRLGSKHNQEKREERREKNKLSLKQLNLACQLLPPFKFK